MDRCKACAESGIACLPRSRKRSGRPLGGAHDAPWGSQSSLVCSRSPDSPRSSCPYRISQDTMSTLAIQSDQDITTAHALSEAAEASLGKPTNASVLSLAPPADENCFRSTGLAGNRFPTANADVFPVYAGSPAPCDPQCIGQNIHGPNNAADSSADAIISWSDTSNKDPDEDPFGLVALHRKIQSWIAAYANSPPILSTTSKYSETELGTLEMLSVLIEMSPSSSSAGVVAVIALCDAVQLCAWLTCVHSACISTSGYCAILFSSTQHDIQNASRSGPQGFSQELLADPLDESFSCASQYQRLHCNISSSVWSSISSRETFHASILSLTRLKLCLARFSGFLTAFSISVTNDQDVYSIMHTVRRCETSIARTFNQINTSLEALTPGDL